MAGDGWERPSYDLFPDGPYAKELKRGALALSDFFLNFFKFFAQIWGFDLVLNTAAWNFGKRFFVNFSFYMQL